MATDKKNRELANRVEIDGEWDLDTPVAHEHPREARRAVVSVPFQPAEFARVTEGARVAGERISVFIRHATLERVSRQHEPDMAVWVEEGPSSGTDFLATTGDRAQSAPAERFVLTG